MLDSMLSYLSFQLRIAARSRPWQVATAVQTLDCHEALAGFA